MNHMHGWKPQKPFGKTLRTPDLKHYFTESKEEELPLRRAIPGPRRRKPCHKPFSIPEG